LCTYILVDYAIYQDTNPAFDFATKSNYELNVECIDEHGGTSLTKTLFVYILKNQPPVITNLQGWFCHLTPLLNITHIYFYAYVIVHL